MTTEGSALSAPTLLSVTPRSPRSMAARAVGAAAALALLTGCSTDGDDEEPADASPSAAASASASGSPEACREVVDSVIAAVQRYVDQYAPGSDAAGGKSDREPAPEPSANAPDLPGQIESAQKRLADLGCTPREATEPLAEGLAGVRAEGPIATAVRDQLNASLTGRVSPSRTTVQVAPGEDLSAVLPELAPGSTVELAAGEHRLDDTLVLLRGVRLVGAGRGKTTLITSAADTGLLALSPDRIDLVDLSLSHEGSSPASLVVGSSSTRLALERVVLSGARQATRQQRERLMALAMQAYARRCAASRRVAA